MRDTVDTPVDGDVLTRAPSLADLQGCRSALLLMCSPTGLMHLILTDARVAGRYEVSTALLWRGQWLVAWAAAFRGRDHNPVLGVYTTSRLRGQGLATRAATELLAGLAADSVWSARRYVYAAAVASLWRKAEAASACSLSMHASLSWLPLEDCWPGAPGYLEIGEAA